MKIAKEPKMFIRNGKQNAKLVEDWDVIKFVMCTLVSRAHMTFYILTKWYTVPVNQGTYNKLNQIRRLYCFDKILKSLEANNRRDVNQYPQDHFHIGIEELRSLYDFLEI